MKPMVNVPTFSFVSEVSVAGRSRLVVEDARVSDTGTYMCIAENAAGVVQKIATAKVNVPPKLLVAPGNTAVRIADQVSVLLNL